MTLSLSEIVFNTRYNLSWQLLVSVWRKQLTPKDVMYSSRKEIRCGWVHRTCHSSWEVASWLQNSPDPSLLMMWWPLRPTDSAYLQHGESTMSSTVDSWKQWLVGLAPLLPYFSMISKKSLRLSVLSTCVLLVVDSASFWFNGKVMTVLTIVGSQRAI